MDELKYAETVIEQVHIKTLQGDLLWNSSDKRILAEPTPTISVRIGFDDLGTNSAVWEYAMLTHPVGKGMTMLCNPVHERSRLCKLLPSGKTLDRLNEIFHYVLLAPREKEFQAAMKELCK